MIIEGLLSIQKGDSPLMVQEKLLSTLPESQQDEVLESLKQI
jgi:chemotaxis protein MotA